MFVVYSVMERMVIISKLASNHAQGQSVLVNILALRNVMNLVLHVKKPSLQPSHALTRLHCSVQKMWTAMNVHTGAVEYLTVVIPASICAMNHVDHVISEWRTSSFLVVTE